MSKLRVFVAGCLLVLMVAAFLFWREANTAKLILERARLRQVTLELESLREENARLAKGRIDPAELERLRAGQSELVRLRGQVAQLRRQVSEMAGKRPTVDSEKGSTVAGDTSALPVETYTATAQGQVGWNQTMLIGGWVLPSGKRALVTLQPSQIEGGDATQIELQAKIVEMPETVFGQMGMKTLAADGKTGEGKISNITGVLTSEQTAAVMMAIEQMPGVDVLSAPRVITADGRQAQVKVVDVKTAPNGEQYELGPTIDLTPKISDDRTAVQLNVNAQLRLPTAPAK